MTIRRLILLLIVIVAGFSAVFLLPTSAKTEPVGIRLTLPEYVGTWYGTDQQVTDRERQVLASDTEFARKVYTDAAGNQIFASIVLSGHDLDNSIHRPERCLPSQGWTIADSRQLDIPIAGGQKLKVTRLRNVAPVSAQDRKIISVYNLNYYWFVGYHHLTASHLERTFLDIQDRILKGYNQRWAYVTVTSTITKDLMPFGLSEEQTDKTIQEFIREIFPQINSPNEEPGFSQKSEMPVKSGSL